MVSSLISLATLKTQTSWWARVMLWLLLRLLCILRSLHSTWTLGAIMLMLLIFSPHFPVKDFFPEADFIIILKIPSVYLRVFHLSFIQIYIRFLSCGSIELPQVRSSRYTDSGQSCLLKNTDVLLLEEFVTINLGLLLL